MGVTNFRHSLEKRYSALTGQLCEVHANIARIKREVETLAELEAKIPKLEALIESAAMLLEDADPTWRRDHTPAIKPFTHYLPVPFGSCGRRGMEVLRQANAPMTTRQIALEVLRQCGGEDSDPKIIQRTVNAIEASLRKHRGRTVESSGKYPAQWKSIIKADISFDP
ncbi:MAG: hypothetical protein AB7E05_07625 [Sphingobium sp.]